MPEIQAAKNRRFHRGIGRSPFEAVFGLKMRSIAKELIEEEQQNESDIETVKLRNLCLNLFFYR